MTPKISIVIVNDYNPEAPASFEFFRQTLDALAKQDFKEGPVEYIYVESKDLEDKVPEDLKKHLPDLQIIFADANTSYSLKNIGIKHSKADLIAAIDADCQPKTNWLTKIYETFAKHPEVCVVTGKTTYKNQGLLYRGLSLLHRGYVDPGFTGETRYIETTNTGFRKATLNQFPFPEEIGAFSEICHSEKIYRNGRKIYYEPSLEVNHAFHGWGFQKDLYYAAGRATVITRIVDPEIRFSWLIKLGYFSIPAFFLCRLALDWYHCVKLSLRWNIKWYEIPAVMLLAFAMNFLAIPGIIDGVRAKSARRTGYRYLINESN